MPQPKELKTRVRDESLLIPDQERVERLTRINSVLALHNLEGQYPDTNSLGDVTKYEEKPGVGGNEIELLNADEVVRCGNSGLHLVHFPTQNIPDTPEKSGKGSFWLFFEDKNRAKNNNIIVPTIKDAPSNTQYATDIVRTDDNKMAAVNQRLADLKLKQLPPTANAGQEKILGIRDVVEKNNRFYTVVVYATELPSGEKRDVPIIYNANSDQGIDGVVFATTVRLPEFGLEPRILLGSAYRITQGDWQQNETSRGFYSPRAGGEKRGVQIKLSTVPAYQRGLEEAKDEMGLIKADHLIDLGRTMQDPMYEASVAHFYGLDVTIDSFQEQDLEASEKLNLKTPLSVGEFYSAIGRINEPFTLTAIGKMLIKKGALRLSKNAIKAQNEGERFVLIDQFRIQHGAYLTEAMRGPRDTKMDLNSLGPTYVNNGIARIAPDLSYGETTWKQLLEATKETQDQQKFRLLYPHEVMFSIANNQFDNVTTASLIKTLHAKGYLEVNLSAMQ